MDDWYSGGASKKDPYGSGGYSNFGQIGESDQIHNSDSFNNLQSISNGSGYQGYSQQIGNPNLQKRHVTSTGFDTPLASAINTPGASVSGKFDFEDEPPLLEELGINFSHIYSKTLAVINPRKDLSQDILEDSDLAGPFVFTWVQGIFLLFSGKLHFGYVFGFGVVGCMFIYLILNLMTRTRQEIESTRVISILGYSLLPIVLLSGIAVLITVKSAGWFGLILTSFAIAWSTTTATRFFEKALDMRQQRYLIAYPIFLLYACFALITVF